MQEKYPGLFSRYQPLQGRAWIKTVSTEDRQVWTHLGQMAGEYGRKGGRVRAATARRDKNGKFLPSP